MNPAHFSPPYPNWDNFVRKMYTIGGLAIVTLFAIILIAHC